MPIDLLNKSLDNRDPIEEGKEIVEMLKSIPRDVKKIGWGALIPITSLLGLVGFVWWTLSH